MKRIALTGAAGNVASLVRGDLTRIYGLRLIDRRNVGRCGENEQFVRADVRSLGAMRRAFNGCDAVVHLAGIGGMDSFDDLIDTNVKGTYNVLEAARLEGVRRVVLASTGHVTGFYRRSDTISETDPVRPDSLYGVSKVACEALGRFYADKYGLQVACIRIGRLSAVPQGEADLAIWCSPRDLARLLRIAIDLPGLRYEVVYGVSNNTVRWWSNAAAKRLGYEPHDDASSFAFDLQPRRDVGALVQGAEFAAKDFSGEIERFT